jgi:hypothetical protein
MFIPLRQSHTRFGDAMMLVQHPVPEYRCIKDRGYFEGDVNGPQRSASIMHQRFQLSSDD